MGALDWNALRDVLAVAEAGSLSGAARQLGVSQSTMSRRIASLAAAGLYPFATGEDGRLDLTESGRLLVEAARGMRISFDQIDDHLRATQPTLRIAACETTSRLFMGPLLRQWSASGGKAVELGVFEDLFAPDLSYDLIISPQVGDEPEAGVPVGWLNWALYASADYLDAHPVAAPVRRLDGHRIIQASGSLARFEAFRRLEELGGTVALLMSSPLAQMEAAALGQGIALLPAELVGDDRRLVRIAGFALPPVPVWLITSAQKSTLPRVAAFLRFSRRHFGGAAQHPARD